MIYVMSDLHGCYDKYKKMLSFISLKETDTLYILGDVLDRGADGIRIILDLFFRKNIVCLCGNHEYKARFLLKQATVHNIESEDNQVMNMFREWFLDGGKTTFESFMKLGKKEQNNVLSYLNTLPFFERIEVKKHNFFLSHTVPEKERMPDFENCHVTELILGEPDYEETYFDDVKIVTGHTPTWLISQNSKGKIWMGNNHIAIDCGAVYGYPLGCICLDTMKEYYVD